MKQFYDLAVVAVASLLGLALTGCRTQHPIAVPGGGYEEISHSSHTLLPGDHPPRISLNHVAGDQPSTLIWPSLYCENTAIRDDLIIFVANKSFLRAGQASVHPRLFAVRFPELPVDITGEVLWRWAQTNGKDLTKTFSRFSLAIPESKDGRVAIHLEFWSGSYMSDEDWPETGDLSLDWPEVIRLMNSVETKGIRQKDPQWHSPYFAEPQ